MVRGPYGAPAADDDRPAISRVLDRGGAYRRPAAARLCAERLSAELRFAEAVDLQPDWRLPGQAGVPLALSGAVLLHSGFHRRDRARWYQGVNKGQTEAAGALGLRSGPILRLVVVPQAMRIVIPPLTSQYLNLTKNSSLAIAIGYPDLTATAGTVLNQTGQAVEGVLIMMIAYLILSLVTSAVMNVVNARMALVER
ncbi:ABC transporter permease subunit [Mesorhizobium sp. M8A.F.Ca.ET.057.01.1.1]|uniref:ABC transporter permease subunit n=1 Tax=Mesorhizobium sp. M8A.F.Ca.ET.057.01.1.1 TaxID=2493679 RepID=UPI001FE06702|nr:ABC transporter permease subunit [Mesorhizobium sp. M8A.F.Ca.ET.057.01.1.1]